MYTIDRAGSEMVVTNSRKFYIGEGLQDGLRFWPLQRDQGCRIRLIEYLYVRELLRLFQNPGKIFLDVGRVNDQHVVIFIQVIDKQVIDGIAVGQTKLRVERLFNGELPH